MMAALRSLMAVAMMAAMVDLALGENYVVGAPAGGWDLSTNYTLWASKQTFYSGDTLTFVYTSGHDVLEVTISDYVSCTAPTNPISSDKSGNTRIALKEAGTTRYFICATTGHCRSGMKLAIDVLSASSPRAAASPSPAPPPDFPPDGAADSLPAPLPPPLLVSPPAPPSGTLSLLQAGNAVGGWFALTLMIILAL